MPGSTSLDVPEKYNFDMHPIQWCIFRHGTLQYDRGYDALEGSLSGAGAKESLVSLKKKWYSRPVFGMHSKRKLASGSVSSF